MDFLALKKAFNKRWQITEDAGYAEEFKKFRTRILNILADIDSHIPAKDISYFCQLLGIPENWHENEYTGHRWSQMLIDALKKEGDEKRFYFLLEVITHLEITTSMGRFEETYSKPRLLRKIEEAVDLSSINVEVKITADGAIFYPRGEKLLDEELVDSTLDFIGEDGRQHFIDALSHFQEKKSVRSAESLRRCLEEYLREKLVNDKGLNANITELGARLKRAGEDPQVRNVVIQTFGYVDQYFNENSKHNDGNITDFENEYLIYQVALLIRFINKSLSN